MTTRNRSVSVDLIAGQKHQAEWLAGIRVHVDARPPFEQKTEMSLSCLFESQNLRRGGRFSHEEVPDMMSAYYIRVKEYIDGLS